MSVKDVTNEIKTVTDPAAALLTVDGDSWGFYIYNQHATLNINLSFGGTASATTYPLPAGAVFQKEGAEAVPYRNTVISGFGASSNNAVAVLDVRKA